MTGNFLNRTQYITVLLGALIQPIHPAFAETVEVKLPTGIIATADFRAGQSSHPAVLLLHGFLQTHQVLPMNALGNTLADQGYTVLIPTLSLGINKRSKSLSCEAVHTHTKEGDVVEIGFWTDWLAGKGYNSIVFIGHSAGSLQILQYISQKPSPVVKKAILTSMIPLRSMPQDVQKARALVKQAGTGKPVLERYTLGYCNKNYVAPAAAYLSYAASDGSKNLDQISKAKVPMEVILGAADSAVESTWPEKIRAHGIPVTLIDKAGHFFDGAQEFDLADKVESILKSLPAGNK